MRPTVRFLVVSVVLGLASLAASSLLPRHGGVPAGRPSSVPAHVDSDDECDVFDAKLKPGPAARSPLKLPRSDTFEGHKR